MVDEECLLPGCEFPFEGEESVWGWVRGGGLTMSQMC